MITIQYATLCPIFLQIRMNVYKTKEDAIINASTHWEGTSANATQVTLYPRTGGLANVSPNNVP